MLIAISILLAIPAFSFPSACTAAATGARRHPATRRSHPLRLRGGHRHLRAALDRGDRSLGHLVAGPLEGVAAELSGGPAAVGSFARPAGTRAKRGANGSLDPRRQR